MEEMSDYSAQLVFECGQSAVDLFVDNVSLKYVSETSIDRPNQPPVNYKLYANYPNPFNPTTNITYQLSKTSHVDLSLYNILGQKVVTLVKENQRAGYHQVEWNAIGFASGIYYYRIETAGFQDVKKMILLR
jgi:hypothetical protein